MSRIGTDPEYSSGKYAENSRPSDGRNLMYMTNEQRLAYWGGQKHAEKMETNEKQVSTKTKKCSRCRQVKHLDCFGCHPKSKDGHLAECKVCRGSKGTSPVYNIDSEVKEMLNSVPKAAYIDPKTETLTDKALADELRRRGYEVRATKTLEI